MPFLEQEIAPDTVDCEPIVRSRAAPRECTQARRQPPHAVVLHNDDINGFGYVVGVIRKVFNYNRMKAFRMTLAAHIGGRSTIWSGSLEVAELKADQVRSCGADPEMKSRGALPLRVSIEPLKGG